MPSPDSRNLEVGLQTFYYSTSSFSPWPWPPFLCQHAMELSFLFLLIPLYLTAKPSYGAKQKVSLAACHGTPQAQEGIIYFHGLDPRKPSKQELFNREQLKKLSERKNFRLAIMRSHYICSKNVACWPMSTSKKIKLTLDQTLKASKSCLGSVNKISAIGFSNGGYYVSKLVQMCHPNPFRKVIAIGSAGSWSKKVKGSLEKCGQLDLFVGNKDVTFPKAKKYYQYLKKRQAHISFHDFPGGHELPKLSLIFP